MDPRAWDLPTVVFFKNKHGFGLGYRSTFSKYYYDKLEYVGFKKTLDSIQVFSVLKYESTRNSRHSVRTGYEYRLGNRRVKGILGIDLINGIEVNNNAVVYDYHYSGTFYIDTSAHYSTLHAGIDTTVINWGTSRHTLSYVIGFAPVIGLHINFSSRWSLTCSMFYDFFWNFPFKTDYTGVQGIALAPPGGLNVDVESLFADVSLTYSFGKARKVKPAKDL
jgi:hypothetical protein